MKDKSKPLQRIIKLARQAQVRPPPAEVVTVPHGFSTRVVARWMDKPQAWGLDIFERLAWWASAASVAICLITVFQHQFRPEPSALDLLLEVQTAEVNWP